MAEGIMRHLGAPNVEVMSAGTHPKAVHPLSIRVMEEVGLDISKQQSKSVEGFLGRSFDFVITVSDPAVESPPSFPGGAQRLHWSIGDPAAVAGGEDQKLDAFRVVRDDLFARIWHFLSFNASGRSSV
jgi:arsenate reductase